MPLPIVTAKSPYLDCQEPHHPAPKLFHSALAGVGFLLLCVLILFGATRPLDWWGQHLLTEGTSPWLDVIGFLLTLLGITVLTGAMALLLAVRGWRRNRGRGLGPLLLFVGVGLEVLFKTLLPHPGPPPEFWHPLAVPEYLRQAAAWLDVSPRLVDAGLLPPYAFPSGHMLRTTFLVAMISAHRPRWRWWGYAVVLSMAVTRLYCNEHWASDVVGGTLLGWALAGVALSLEQEQRSGAAAVVAKAA